jgi:hypothetical protein
MRSSDLATREDARLHLLRLGRPAIDEVYPELVAEEVGDRVAAGSWPRVFVPRARFIGGMTDTEFYECDVDLALLGPRSSVPVEASFVDERWCLLCPKPLQKALTEGRVLFVTGFWKSDETPRLWLAVPLDDREAEILDAVRARLNAP